MKIFRKVKKVLNLIQKRPKGWVDYCLDFFSALVKSEKAYGLPVHITIEPTNLCNLQCPVCETGGGVLKRPKGSMQFEVFRAIIDKISGRVNSILLYYMGEPFLNDDIYGMIRYAKEKKIYVTICTNGHFIDPERLVNSGIDEISFQIGGLTEESHSVYRVGSDFKEIVRNIENTVSMKKLLKKDLPKIILGFIVMKHNEYQINDFLIFADKLKVDEARLIAPCVRTIGQAKQYLPSDDKYWIYDRNAFSKEVLKPRRKTHNRCNWIYFSTVILHNGDVVPCCRDVHGEHVMGNIINKDLISIWNSNKYRRFRKALKNNQADLALCSLCSDFGIPTLYTQK